MNDTQKIVSKIIPPDTRYNREDFDNKDIIDNLTETEKSEVENELVNLLRRSQYLDILILDSLVYMKSTKSIPFFEELLKKNKNSFNGILLAVSIFLIDNNLTDMKKIAMECFRELKNTLDIRLSLFHLSKLKDRDINEVIKSYVAHEDVYIASTAKDVVEWHMGDAPPRKPLIGGGQE